MEKTTLRSLLLLMIITGSLFALTACGPETATPGTVAPVMKQEAGANAKTDATVMTKVDTTVKMDAATKIEAAPKVDTTPKTETSTDAAPKADPAPAPVVEPKPEVKVTTKYADGTYTKTGSYTSPAGEEAVTVTVSLKGDVITSVNVSGNSGNSNSQNFQGLFISGVNDMVVGKKLDDVHVGVVNGSSLTGGGFNNAIASIEAAAQK